MCRYGEYGPYKEHYACFTCRKMFRYHQQTSCPQCHLPLAKMGKDFRAPKQKNREHWKVIEVLYQQGVDFQSCGCSGPGYRPSQLKEISTFLASRKGS